MKIKNKYFKVLLDVLFIIVTICILLQIVVVYQSEKDEYPNLFSYSIVNNESNPIVIKKTNNIKIGDYIYYSFEGNLLLDKVSKIEGEKFYFTEYYINSSDVIGVQVISLNIPISNLSFNYFIYLIIILPCSVILYLLILYLYKLIKKKNIIKKVINEQIDLLEQDVVNNKIVKELSNRQKYKILNNVSFEDKLEYAKVLYSK